VILELESPIDLVRSEWLAPYRRGDLPSFRDDLGAVALERIIKFPVIAGLSPAEGKLGDPVMDYGHQLSRIVMNFKVRTLGVSPRNAREHFIIAD
jgi:hypothetical protein